LKVSAHQAVSVIEPMVDIALNKIEEAEQSLQNESRRRDPVLARREIYIALLLIFSMAGIVGRFATYLRNSAVLEPDSNRYLELAEGLKTGCGFARRVGDSCRDPEVLRTPGYPLFLAISGRIGTSILIVSLVGGIVIFFTGFVIGERWSRRAGLLAAFLLAAEPSSIYRSSTVMTEPIFQVFVAAGVLLEVSALWRDRTSVILFLAGSFILSVSPLVRPVGMFLWPFAWVPILAMPAHTLVRRRVFVIAAAVLTLTPVLAWSARNKRLANSFTFSTEGPVTAYYFVGGGVLATSYRTTIWEQINNLEKELNVKDLLDTPATLNSLMISRAVLIAAWHPKAAIEFEFFSALRMAVAPDEAALRGWLRVGPTPYMGEPYFMHLSGRVRDMLKHPWLLLLMWAQAGWLIFVWIGIGRFFVSFVTSWREIPNVARGGLAIIFGSACVLAVLSTGSAASSGRMRVTFAPMIAMLAGMGWSGPETFARLGSRLAVRRSSLPAEPRRSLQGPSSRSPANRLSENR
jgi:hypothetical protein